MTASLYRVAFCFLIVGWVVIPAHAQAPKDFDPPVELFADQVGLQNLPMPGAPFTVKARLSNTKDTERRLRAFVVRDGRVTDVSPMKAYLDEYDQPTYEIQMYAPLAELSYQFVLYNPDGSFSTSQRFSVRRPCIPFIDITKVKLEPKNQGEARLEGLIKLSRGLEREIAAYDVAVKVLEDLTERLKQ